MLETIFHSKSKSSILSLFLLKNFKGSIRETAKQVKCSPMQARNTLLSLEHTGLLKSERIGNAKIYSVNEASSFLDELRALLVKTSRFDLQIKEKLSHLEGIEFAFIFGSYAEGTFKGESDIDLFILGTPEMKKLNSLLFALERKIDREIQVVVYTRKDFDSKKSYGFIKNILTNKKIMLIGEENELS